MKRQPTLSPLRRHLLLDAVRPPGGFQLDRAVGTCFSLDLMTALLVPLAFALFDSEDETNTASEGESGAAGGDVVPDPVKTLAAVQPFASRMTLYCENGRTAALREGMPALISFLEDSLRPVQPPLSGSFHPKVWVLRYCSSRNPSIHVHRVLCLSRNLTFDRSWDTILRLEEAGDENSEPGQTKPLVSFLRRLERLGPSRHARELAKSIASVSFAPPRGFRSLKFLPLFPGGSSSDDPVGRGDELLIASPFLGAGRIAHLRERWDRVHLASRAETLDRTSPDLLRSLGKRRVWAFRGPDEGLLNDVDEAVVPSNEETAERMDLAGLHAKIFSGTVGKESFLIVGSANCTDAAFMRNYEFCVRLEAKNRTAGPGALLDSRDDRSSFRELLQPYEPRTGIVEKTDAELELERLEVMRREIAELELEAKVRRKAESSFDLALRAEGSLPTLDQGDKLICWPVTLGRSRAAGPRRGRNLARWQMGSLASVTGLIAFELKSPKRGVPAVAFVLKARLTGDLEGRLDAVRTEVLGRDPKRLLRFLLLLLAAGGDDQSIVHFAGNGRNGSTTKAPAGHGEVPLLETLLRTFAREPGRLQAFRRAIEGIEEAELPEIRRLLEIWRPVEQALPKKAES